MERSDDSAAGHSQIGRRTMNSPEACIKARDEWISCRSGFGHHSQRELRSLRAIVTDYIHRHRRRARAEVEYYRNLPTLREAVERSGRAERPDGKRHGHQARIGRRAIRLASQRLKNLDFRRCARFEELHALLDEAIGPVPGIGRLMVYDTAVRIGAKLGLEPNVVYLHAGTREGARALGLGAGRDYLDRGQLPHEFRHLSPREIEDCLCIYKDRLRAMSV